MLLEVLQHQNHLIFLHICLIHEQNITRIPCAANFSRSSLMNIINMIAPMPLPWSTPLTKITWSDNDKPTSILCVRPGKKITKPLQ